MQENTNYPRRYSLRKCLVYRRGFTLYQMFFRMFGSHRAKCFETQIFLSGSLVLLLVFLFAIAAAAMLASADQGVWYIAGVLLGFFLLSLLALRRVTRNISKPIANLASLIRGNHLDSMSEHGLNAEIRSYPDEVRQLYQGFGMMAATVKNHYEYMERVLEDHNSSLVFLQNYLDKNVDTGRRAEQSLSEYGKYIVKLLETYGDIVIRFDGDLRYKYISPGIEVITGIPSELFINKKPSEVYGTIDKAADMELYIKKILEGQETKTEYFEFKGQGRVTMYLVRMIPEKEPDGSVRNVLAIARDITEFRNMQKEIEKLDRLNLVGEMAAGIGHEVRNPLTTVRGLLQLMEMREDNSNAKEKYQLMIEEIDRANSIITAFLSLAKNKNVVLKECSLSDILRTLLPLLEAEALLESKSVTMELESDSTIFADDKEIRQMLLNLARNGFEAMQPGGVLEIYTVDAADKVQLIIRDSGKGIPELILEKIGTPFITTKESGTGLGLPVCYSIAARHKAEVRVETSGLGTSFFISFPQAGKLHKWPEISRS